MYCLDEEDGGHGGKAEGTVHGAQSRGRALLVAVAALLVAPGAFGARVVELTLAEIFALNQLLLGQRVVELACLGDVIRRLNVERSLDLLQLGGLDPVNGVSDF